MVSTYFSVFNWLIKKILEVLIARVFLVFGIFPFDNGLSLPDHNVEEGVK